MERQVEAGMGLDKLEQKVNNFDSGRSAILLVSTTETPYTPMHTVVETPAYLRAADQVRLTLLERDAFVTMIAENPTVGEVIPATGGCRKMRLAGRGKGKSGGYRVITFFSGAAVPVFLVTIFSKGERADLSGAERKGLAKLAGTLVASLSRRAR